MTLDLLKSKGRISWTSASQNKKKNVKTYVYVTRTTEAIPRRHALQIQGTNLTFHLERKFKLDFPAQIFTNLRPFAKTFFRSLKERPYVTRR